MAIAEHPGTKLLVIEFVIIAIVTPLMIGQAGYFEFWLVVSDGLIIAAIVTVLAWIAVSIVVIYPDKLVTLKGLFNGKIPYGRKEIELSSNTEIKLIEKDYDELSKKFGVEPILDTIVIKTGSQEMPLELPNADDIDWYVKVLQRIKTTTG